MQSSRVADALFAAEYRMRVEAARTVARRRYHDHLATAFGRRGCPDSDELADIAIDVLTAWRDVVTGQRCLCSCHPRLPQNDFHDYGFGCNCARTPLERQTEWDDFRRSVRDFWQSPQGEQIKAAERAADAELQSWLAVQLDVALTSRGGLAPEQWCGEVAGHSFYFRERHGEWSIALNFEPRSRLNRVGHGIDGDDSNPKNEPESGDLIASGTTDVDGYGGTPLERAQFIVDTIRVYLAQKACEFHNGDLSPIEALLGHKARWCPACGIRIHAPG